MPIAWTRRKLLAAGAGGLVAVGIGRFAVGGTFESHVAGVLGLPREDADRLLELMRAEIGPDYDARAAAFLAATTAPGRWVLPRSSREKALDSFVGPLFGVEGGFVAPFAYCGLRPAAPYGGCSTLVRG